jgi:hypothetical protein
MRLDAVTHSIAQNSVVYRIGLGDAITRPFPWDLAINAYQLVALVPLAVGAVLWVRASSRSLALAFAVLYGAAITTLPYGEPRYLWPVFPIVGYALWRGVTAIAARLAPRLPPAAVVLPAGLLVATGAALTLSTHPFPRTWDSYPDVREVEAVLVRGNAERPLRVVFVRPGQLAWRTRIPAMPLFEAPPDTTVAELRRTCMTHVVVGSLGLMPGPDSAMQRAVDAHPEAFEPVFRNGSFRAYRFTAGRPDCLLAVRAGR